MPIALIVVGAVFIIAAVRDKQVELGDLLVSQFAGPDSFTIWALGFVLVSMIGTIDALRPLSRALMGLMLLVLFLANSRDGDLVTSLRTQLTGTGQ